MNYLTNNGIKSKLILKARRTPLRELEKHLKRHSLDIGMPFTNALASGKKRDSLRPSSKICHPIAIYRTFPSTVLSSKFIKMQALEKELIGKSRGGNTTKIHTATDTSVRPVNLILTGGQVHDVMVAAELISDLKPKTVLADTAYDSNKFREQIKNQGTNSCIKPRRFQQRAS